MLQNNIFNVIFRQARTGHLAREGLRVLNNLMACNYTKLESYLDFGKSHNWLFSHNNRNYIIHLNFV